MSSWASFLNDSASSAASKLLLNALALLSTSRRAALSCAAAAAFSCNKPWHGCGQAFGENSINSLQKGSGIGQQQCTTYQTSAHLGEAILCRRGSGRQQCVPMLDCFVDVEEELLQGGSRLDAVLMVLPSKAPAPIRPGQQAALASLVNPHSPPLPRALPVQRGCVLLLQAAADGFRHQRAHAAKGPCKATRQTRVGLCSIVNQAAPGL